MRVDSRHRPAGRIITWLSVIACFMHVFAFGLFAQTAPGTLALPPGDTLFTVWLVGDAGEPKVDEPDPTVTLLRRQLQAASKRSAVVFLGDNIYCCGMPDSSSTYRSVAQRRIDTVLTALEGFRGRTVFIPGNHDWNKGRAGGLANLQREERYIEERLGDDVFKPDDGEPGPVEIELTDDLSLLVLDTQWWLADNLPTTDDVSGRSDLLFEIKREVEENKSKNLLIVGHHPVSSGGSHAGYFPLRTHLFPLTAVWDKAYIPMPLVGSLVPLFVRQFGGSTQDLAHPRYRSMRAALSKLFDTHERLVYASGHSHSLQLFRSGPLNKEHYQIVSGSASRPTYVTRLHDALYAKSVRGFATLHYMENQSVWVTFWAAEGEQAGMPLYRRILFEGRAPVTDEPPTDNEPAEKYTPPSGSDRVTRPANAGYEAGAVKSFLLGSHHRRIWATPVEAPILDLDTRAGGLTPLKRGGGMQTVSLRLRGGDGRDYVLRSLDKDPSKTVPRELQGTIATDIVQDQIASIHPYGALVVPPLAEAAGVFHTLPELVYVPDHPRLGPFREDFGDGLMLLEDRPDDDMSSEARYGNSTDVKSAASMYKAINEDNDDRVDQLAFVRARLLDMLVSDWDRHREQWRWATFPDPDGDGKIYRPIPRDRDWAFNRMNGFFPSLAKYVDPKFQQFSTSYGNIKGLTTNGLEQDRRFTSGVQLDKWLEIANDLQESITDSVIDAAVRMLPESVYQIHGPEIAEVLKVRRSKLDEAATEYYKILARVVDIVGSDKHEEFVIDRHDDGSVDVEAWKINKKGERREMLYQRHFLYSETREIRIFGLDGEDRFVVRGPSRGGPRVVMIAGSGADTLLDESVSSGRSPKNIYYDTPGSRQVAEGRTTKLILTDRPENNEYDPLDYKHNALLPQLFFGSNRDDGLFVGGGFKIVRHGFRKAPFASSHKLVGNVSARTQAFNVKYDGLFSQRAGEWDVGVVAHVLSPNNIRNFYGLGNETDNTEEDRSFYQARLTQATLAPSLVRSSETGVRFQVGPHIRVTKVRSDFDRFIRQPDAGVSENTFEDQWFAGASASLTLESLDRPSVPSRGVRWTNEVDVNFGIRNSTEGFSKLSTDLTLYLTPIRSAPLTLALRAGGRHNLGDFPFYAANTIGGVDNLRGHRSTRYAGRSAAYQNAEVRIKLRTISTYLTPGDVGVLGFLDNGRVWTDAERSSVWHQGYGGGAWLTLFQQIALAGWVGTSSDETTFSFQLGFQY